MAQVALSMLAFLGHHLRERGHDVEMKLIHLFVKLPRTLRSLRSQDVERMFDVPFLLSSNRGKGLAETSRGGLPHAGIARDCERFEHDLLNDQAGDEVALRDRAHECFADSLPIFGVDI